jgi:NitT/TauT family transport system substrate-binding protein
MDRPESGALDGISRRTLIQEKEIDMIPRTLLQLILSIGLGLCAALTPMERARADDIVRVGEGPFITGGGFYVANARGYFKKMGLDIQVQKFNDGALAVPAMLAGELDITLMTANASFFNSIAKGAPLVVVLDRGHNRPGYGYLAVNVTQELYDQGIHSAADFSKLKGKKIGVGAVGSINQYNTARALQKAGLDPRKDVQWITGVSQPDLMKMLGKKQVDVTDLAYQFGFFAQNNKWGPIVANGDQIEPNSSIGVYAVNRDFLQKKRDVIVRFAIAYLQGVKEFDAAAKAPDKNPEILEILAKNTFLNKPELVKAIAPHWSYTSEDGIPPIDSIMAMQDYWADYFVYVEKKVIRAQLFDLSVAKEAKKRLDQEKPFTK